MARTRLFWEVFSSFSLEINGKPAVFHGFGLEIDGKLAVFKRFLGSRTVIADAPGVIVTTPQRQFVFLMRRQGVATESIRMCA